MKCFHFFCNSLLTLLFTGVLLTPLFSVAQEPKTAASRESEILLAITDYVRQKSDSVAETRIKHVSFSGLNNLPLGRLDYELVVPRQWDGWSTTGIAVIVRQGSRVVGNIMARVEIEALAEMVVAARNIEPGTVISAADLVLRKQELAGTQGRYLARIGDVAGKKARSTIRSNMAVRPEQIEKIPLIKSGQMVMMVIENDRMRISVTGKAKNSGAEGDIITVQNMDSLKDISAQVKNESTVLVLF